MVKRRTKRAKPLEYDSSGYKWMWLFAMFDLPTTEIEMKRDYTRFRKLLLSQGFSMLQFSVYARHCPSEEAGEGVRHQIERAVPGHGQVRLLMVTDKQFSRMAVFYGKSRRPAEDPPQQFMLF